MSSRQVRNGPLLRLSGPEAQLSITRFRTSVSMAGELDLASAAAAHEALRRAEHDGPYVVLDLRELAFIDAVGLAVVIAADARAREAGRRLVVRVRPGAVRRLFALSRVEPSLDVQVDQPATEGPEVPGRFTWEVVHDGGSVRVVPVGELDLASCGQLEPAIRELLQPDVDRLIIDLRRVSFLDSTGLRLALELEAEARSDGFDLELIPGPPDVQRVFAITGTLETLPFVAVPVG